MSRRPERGLRPEACSHCGGPIVWGTLQNGRRRAFNRRPVLANDVDPTARYAYSRRVRAVVNLDGERHCPPLVLIEHACREYAEWRERQIDAQLFAFSTETILEALDPNGAR